MRTNDLLLNAPLPRSTGFDNAVQNVGEIENRGVELALMGRRSFGPVGWDGNFNVTFNRSEVLDLVGQQIPVGAVAGRGEAVLLEEGEPLGNIYGYVFGGVDPETGDAFYQAADGSTTFDPAPEDRRVIGNAQPDFFYGFTNGFSYKGIRLSVFLQGSYGADILNATRIDAEGMTDPKNQLATVLDRWREPGDVTDVPRASFGDTGNSRISTRFVEDASYLRVRTLTLSYELPSDLIGRASLSRLRVYATGENLLTFTDYSGFDPEVNAFGGSNTAFGVDFGTYPQTRTLILGLNAFF